MFTTRPALRWAWAPPLVALAATLAACGSSGANATSSAGSSPASHHFTIGYVPGVTGAAFFSTLVKGMRAEAAKHGMTVIYQGAPDYTPSAQTPVVDSLCTRHPNVLVISPTDPKALAPAVNTCLNAGIPVITADSQLASTSRITSQITTDSTQGAKLAADYLGKALHGSGQIAVLSLSPTSTTQVARVRGLESALKASYPHIKVVTLQYAATPAPTASESTARSILSAHPQIKAFFGITEPNTEGAEAALAAVGETGRVLVAGFDASPTEVSLLKQGKINALVAQQAEQEGVLAAQYAYDKLTGDSSAIKASVQLPDVLLTTSNVNQASMQKYFYTP